jgi:hypothetical protein
MPDAQAWQHRLDTMFPDGAIAVWQHPGNELQYNLCWIRVEDMAGLDPVLVCYTLTDRVLEGLRVLGLATTQQSPLIVTLKLAARSEAGWEPEDPMQLCAAVPAGMAQQTAVMRGLVKRGLAEHYGPELVPQS